MDVPHGYAHVTLTQRVRWTPRAYARHLLALKGQRAQWPCLNALWSRESHWDPHAVNASSGAGGIPQALPPSKMGAGWWGDFRVQVRWGVNRYIPAVYGTPCGAWAHSQATGWY